jgi:hypothetical protein
MSRAEKQFVPTLRSVTGPNFWLNNSVPLHLLRGSDNRFWDLFLFCTFHTCGKTLLSVICCKPGVIKARLERRVNKDRLFIHTEHHVSLPNTTITNYESFCKSNALVNAWNKRYSFCLMVEESDHRYVLHTRRIHVTRYRIRYDMV